MKKRILALGLSIVLLCGSFGQTAIAMEGNSETQDSETEVDSNETGEDESETDLSDIGEDESETDSSETGETESETDSSETDESESETDSDVLQNNGISSMQMNFSNRKVETDEVPKVVTQVKNDGTFSLKVSGVEVDDKSESIQAAIWQVNVSDSVYWYEAVRQDDGSYMIDGTVKNHGYNLGNYIVHVYTKNQEDKLNYITEARFSTKDLRCGSFYEINAENEYTKKIVLDWIEDQGITDKVYFAVWSEEAGQDDLIWYEAPKKDSSYYVDIPLSNHNTLGKYYAHAYIFAKNGERHLLKGLTFNVDELPTSSIEVTEIYEDKGQFDAKIYLNLPQTTISKVLVAVWPEAYSNSIYWYEAERDNNGMYSVKVDVKNHGYHIGKYYLHTYVTNIQGKQEYINATNITLKVSGGAFYEAQSDSQYTKKLVLDSIVDYNIKEKVYFAVWSAVGGQDDLVWYEANYSNGVYSANVQLENHNTKGKYYAHAYIQGKDGLKHILKGIVFEVNDLPESSIDVVKMDNSKGQFDVKFHVNKQSSNISKVSIAVWPEAYPGSIYWYEAIRENDGTYSIKADVKNHDYHIGKYYIHGYVTDKQGQSSYIVGTNTVLEVSATDLAVSGKDKYSVKLTLSGAQTQGIANKVQVAVWSIENGSNDIYWHEAERNGSTYTADVMLFRHKGIGTYCADAYILGKDGQRYVVARVMFDVDELPKKSIRVFNIDTKKGQFSVEMDLDRPDECIDTLYLPVWPMKEPQSVYWYEAKKQDNGKYIVKVDIKNHGYNTGVYYMHEYIKDNEGNLNFVDSGTYNLKMNLGEFYKVDTNDVNIKNLVYVDNVNKVASGKISFAVWSSVNGQDDIVWYDATKEGNKYVSKIMLHNHANTGKYIAHAYYKDENGKSVFLKELTFEFDTKHMPSDEINVGNIKDGLFDVNVYLTRKWNKYQKIEVAVWAQSKTDTVHWYAAEKQNDGSFQITVDAKKHQWISDRYMIHVYATNGEGSKTFVEGSYVDISLEKKVIVEKLDNCSVYVKIYGAGKDVVNVRFPAWSLENGQDDVVWYEGERNDDGSWGAKIHSMNHKNSGEYMCHIYGVKSDSTSSIIETAEFEISEKWKNTWVWIDGYKRYINADGEIDTDVSRLVTGPYYIKVYKWSNYLIIYAKDEYGNYTVPVKAMVASCGNNTPTGTYYTPNRWRWLTMVDDSKAQWCTQIIGDYLFHSVPYRTADPTTLYVDNKFNYLGETKSLGCIRLQAGDAKWIYDNCQLGTKVTITPSESSGPISKPAFTPLPSWHTWDPTDPTVQYLCKQHGCH